jgi:hypothetical protein
MVGNMQKKLHRFHAQTDIKTTNYKIPRNIQH